MFKLINFKLICILLLFLFSFCHSANAEEISKEYRIKAAILIKLVQFFTWDESSFEDDSKTINFCLLSPEPFGEFIESVVKKKNTSSKLPLIDILRVNNNSEGLSPCHVLFISQQSSPLIQPHSKHLLLITENNGLSNTEMHLNLFSEVNKVKFEINVDNIRNSKINVKPLLLKVAKVVHNTEAAGLP